jgi:pyruvate formate lyase activating enzyme
MNGQITHIQRMSTHDGPGIRSTIFLKGCNLQCKWCHNPETFSSQPELEWLSDKCISCQTCLLVCPSEALSLQNGKVAFEKSLCTACFNCVDVCFPEAIQKIGREISPEELFAEVEQDFSFFRESNGGITFSGGEPMLQLEFVKETLRLFRQAGIHTAIETNLNVPWSWYEQVLPEVDFVMADLKLVDDHIHHNWTGASNRQILQNIINLDHSGKTYILRTPIVPGVNDSQEQLEPIFEFVSRLKNIQKYELLPFHPLAASKYKNLGIPNPFEANLCIPASKLKEFDELLIKYKKDNHERKNKL